jgi:hypothetical protein
MGDASMVMPPGAWHGDDLCGSITHGASTALQQMHGQLIAL